MHELVNRAHHPAERDLRSPVCVRQSRADHRDVAPFAQPSHKAIDSAGWDDRIAVEEKEEVPFRRTNGHVVGSGIADVGRVLEDNHIGELFPDGLDAAILGAVVDDDHLVIDCW